MYGENKKPCNECAVENIEGCLGCSNSDNPNEINEIYKEESDAAEKETSVNKVYMIKNRRGLTILIPIFLFCLYFLISGTMSPEERIKLVATTTFFAILLVIILVFVPSYVAAEITDKYIRTYEYNKKKKKTRLTGFAYWKDIDGWYYDKLHYLLGVDRSSPDKVYIFTKNNSDLVVSQCPRWKIIPKLRKYLGKPGISHSTGEKIRML